jgi:hypothetical protein|tara:strand:+ start:763 stop:948 length:186 start_codon:yes stop_codon:yes gene_type:complete
VYFELDRVLKISQTFKASDAAVRGTNSDASSIAALAAVARAATELKSEMGSWPVELDSAKF